MRLRFCFCDEISFSRLKFTNDVVATMRFPIIQNRVVASSIQIRHRFIHVSKCLSTSDPDVFMEQQLSPKTKQLYDRHRSAIIYSSFLEARKLKLGFVKTKKLTQFLKHRQASIAEENVEVKPFSLALKYWDESKSDFDEKSATETNPNETQWQEEIISEIAEKRRRAQLMRELKYNSELVARSDEDKEQKSFVNDWMNDYDCYDDSESSTHSQFGTPDPAVPVSKVPCYGCGSLLHCAEPSLPGYLPSEIFKKASVKELKVRVTSAKYNQRTNRSSLALEHTLPAMPFSQEL